ncbi:hypothetical protein G3I65_41680 [Amycolatopsis sp. SID8362]|nr:hypothetical protein [Amycolatopsis sp. SID8362]
MAAVMFAAGCGNNSLTNTTPGETAQTTSSPPATTATQPNFTGIVLATCSGGSSETLTSINPTNAVQATRHFTLAPGDSAAMDCLASVPTGQVLRQQFNRDFTRMAVSTIGMPEGGTHIGYVDHDVPNIFTNLTPPAVGYADPPNQKVPVFNPATGRIWFTSPEGTGSVDPDIGPRSSKIESAASAQGTGSEDQHAEIFYFTPDGKLPIGLATGAYNIYSLDGKTEVDYSINYRIGNEGQVDNSIPLAELSDGSETCWPKWFMTADAFLCLPTDRTQIFKMTISADRRKIVQTALLPGTRQPVSDVVANPTGTEVAFVSSMSGRPALYTASTMGDSAPKKITDLASEDGRPIDWVQ